MVNTGKHRVYLDFQKYMVNTVYIEGKYRVITEKIQENIEELQKEKRKTKLTRKNNCKIYKCLDYQNYFKDKITKQVVHNFFFNLPESKLILL